MKSKMKVRVPALMIAAILSAWMLAGAQQPASRFTGTITAVSGTTLTVKTDAGEAHQVEVPETAILKQVEPGAKDLSAAQTVVLSSLATGDRVLVRLDPNAPAGSSVALQIITLKQAALAKKQEQEREDWQQRGVGGGNGPETGQSLRRCQFHLKPLLKSILVVPDGAHFRACVTGNQYVKTSVCIFCSAITRRGAMPRRNSDISAPWRTMTG